LAAEAQRDAGFATGAPRRDPAAVAQFIERFAGVLVEAGIPRMPARVFAALLATDSGRLTAAELSEQLRASPAAVSGGVRYLISVGMVSREGEPGSRRHHYRVPDHVWDELVTGRDRLMARWTAVLREGIALVGADTPAGARLAESVQYFQFLSAELPRVLARWQERKAALDRAAERDAGARA
jgi:DNA-binding transcriptional regulator GbsR (MarR family)